MGITVVGPKILFTIPFFGGINITETVVNSWIVMAVIVGACIFLTRNLSVKNPSKKQLAAEKLVDLVNNLIDETMGIPWRSFAPYIGTLFAFSFCSSMSSLFTLRPPTADLSATVAMALITFVMIQFYFFKYKGFFGFFKRFTEPLWIITPLNLVSEIANPVSMSFRHFGNIAAGMVVTSLIYAGLVSLSSFVLQIIPSTFIQSIPIFQVGLPAVLSIYFDVFTSFMQAYIFCMLTMVFVSGTAEE